MLARTKRIASLISLLLLVGCVVVQAPPPAKAAQATPTGDPQGLQDLKGQTMKMILAAHNGAGVESAKPYQKRTDLKARRVFTDHKPYTRSEQTELNGLFPRLPNPDLCMYVYPHLSGENATIPGYTSCFTMYKNNQYALPGETP